MRYRVPDKPGGNVPSTSSSTGSWCSASRERKPRRQSASALLRLCAGAGEMVAMSRLLLWGDQHHALQMVIGQRKQLAADHGESRLLQVRRQRSARIDAYLSAVLDDDVDVVEAAAGGEAAQRLDHALLDAEARARAGRAVSSAPPVLLALGRRGDARHQGFAAAAQGEVPALHVEQVEAHPAASRMRGDAGARAFRRVREADADVIDATG